MKKVMINISLIVVCLALVILVGCQAQQKPVGAAKPANAVSPAKPVPLPAPVAAEASEATTGNPVIKFETNTHDFGEVGPGTKHTYIYKFKNSGDTTLKISEIKSPCNCTVPTLDKKEYASGESGEISVTYTAIAMTLPVTKHVWVVSNDKKTPEFELILKATSVPKVKVQPENLQLTLHDENAGMPELTLTSMDDKSFSIKSFLSLGSAVTASIDPNAVATKFTVKPHVDMDRLRANLSGSITMELTHPECTTIQINYITKADYETNPAIFYLQKARVGKIESKELWVISNYDQTFEIESITSEKGSMKVASQEKQGNKYRLTIEITPPATANAVRFFGDNLIIKIKNGPTLKVRCNAWLERDAATTGAASK
jgi:hypothetical protein